VPVNILAQVSDNAPAGAVLTFAFPIILFAVIAVILYLLFSRPHRRVPTQRVVLADGPTAVPSATAAHGAAVASGMPTASGGGAAESAAEAPGATRDTGPRHAASGDGNVSGDTDEAEGSE
jgi:hypothetical protein